MRASAGHRGWEGAVVIPSTLPTCSGAAMEPSSARSTAAGAVAWCVHLRIVLVGGVVWPRLAIKGGGMEVEEN